MRMTLTLDLDLRVDSKVYNLGLFDQGVHMATQTLVLVPGLGSDAAVWRRTIAALGDEYRCLVGDTLSDDTLQGMARRILDQAPRRFALAGVSMGGMVALEMMKTAPERATQLALVDTNARPDTFRQKAYRRLANVVVGTSKDYGRLAQRNLGSLVHISAASDVRIELVQMSVRVGAKTYVRQNRAVTARGDLREVLPRITIPTAVIVGREDQMTPVALSQEIHALTPGSTFHAIPDCGHLPPIEKPDVLAALLKQLHHRH
jgi:pimeloyl-ACP methyl ester carboxylesterase